MDTITCSLTSDNLDEIRENFKLSASLKLELPSENQTIKTPPEGYMGIYHQFLKAEIRFPVFDFLKTVLSHYKLYIAQLAPNSFRKIICFVMLSRALGVTPSLILFRHFYVTLNTGDWVSFTRRQGVDDIGDCFPSSIKNWKPEFLFVDAKEFATDMSFGEHKNKAVDHPPELSVEQKQSVDQMVVNTVKWSDPDEVTLGMAGLSTYWTSLGKQPICLVGGKTVTLLDRLQRKKFKGTIEVIEGPISDFLGPSVLDTVMEDESSMDLAAAAENASDTTSGSAKVARRGSKVERGGGRPPSHPRKGWNFLSFSRIMTWDKPGRKMAILRKLQELELIPWARTCRAKVERLQVSEKGLRRPANTGRVLWTRVVSLGHGSCTWRQASEKGLRRPANTGRVLWTRVVSLGHGSCTGPDLGYIRPKYNIDAKDGYVYDLQVEEDLSEILEWQMRNAKIKSSVLCHFPQKPIEDGDLIVNIGWNFLSFSRIMTWDKPGRKMAILRKLQELELIPWGRTCRAKVERLQVLEKGLRRPANTGRVLWTRVVSLGHGSCPLDTGRVHGGKLRKKDCGDLRTRVVSFGHGSCTGSDLGYIRPKYNIDAKDGYVYDLQVEEDLSEILECISQMRNAKIKSSVLCHFPQKPIEDGDLIVNIGWNFLSFSRIMTWDKPGRKMAILRKLQELELIPWDCGDLRTRVVSFGHGSCPLDTGRVHGGKLRKKDCGDLRTRVVSVGHGSCTGSVKNVLKRFEIFGVFQSSSTGGSKSPDSEKTSPIADENDVTTSKRRRLIRGGQHPGKAADPLSSNVSSSTTPISSGPVVLAPALFDCPVSSKPSLAIVPSNCNTFPVKAIDFSRSVLPSIASLIRSVDLPIPPAEDMGASSEAVMSSSVLAKPTVVKASKSGFHRTLPNDGLGFGRFAKAVVSSPDLLVASEKQAKDASVQYGVFPMSAPDGVEATLNIPDVPASPESGDKFSGLSTPTTAKASNCVLYDSVSSVESDPMHPSFMSLSTALPAFMHLYTPSGIAAPPGLGNLSEEEGLDRARSLFLEGMHWATEVMLMQRTRAASLLAQKAEFDRVSMKVDEVNAAHVRMMDEKTKLLQDYQRMELRNQELKMEIDVQQYREADLKRLEEAGQQFESLKALFSEKVSGLEILCNQKEVVVTRQEAELQGQKGRLIELEEQVKTLTTNFSAANQESLFYQQMSEQHVGDLSWLLKQRIVLSVRSALNSEDFGNLNALCQTASIQIGLTQACEEMRAKYPLLADEPLLHSYPRSQEELMDRFVTVTGYEYQLLKVLKAGSMDVESLKKYLDEGENGESSFVNEETKGRGEKEGYAESSVDKSRPMGDEADRTGEKEGVDLGDIAGGDGNKGFLGVGNDGDDDGKKDAGEKVGDSDQVGGEGQV
ncbi:hypothetical protein LXL04_011254 [Taraxacum kok-saghyz]